MTDDSMLSDTERKLLDALKHLPPVPRDPGLAEQFKARVQTELLVGPATRPWIVAALAATLMLAIGAGWWVDRSHKLAEVAALRTQLISALEGTSPPRRFEAINVAANSKLRDQQVVDALTRALLTDPNTNVRVAAAAALGRVADRRSLADATERSFGAEGSPFVQTELLRSVQRLPTGDRQRIVAVLLGRKDIDASVRVEAAKVPGT